MYDIDMGRRWRTLSLLYDIDMGTVEDPIVV